MITTTESTTKNQARYGIGYRPATRVQVDSPFKAYDVDVDSIFKVETENVVERVTVPVETETMPVVVKKEKQVAKVEEKEVTSLDVKSKVMLGIYMMVALIMSIIVAATGIIVGNTQAQVNDLSAQVRAVSASISVQSAQISDLASAESVSERAVDSGMTEISGGESIAFIPMSDANSYEASTNFFDKVCDFVSSIIGG